jgi:hypothetical protein
VATQKSPLRPSLASFGATSAIVTSVGLIVGFGSAEFPKSVIVSSLRQNCSSILRSLPS